MDGTTITKHPEDWSLTPNLLDYEATSAAFTWEAARKELDGLPGGRGLNLAHEAVDRHAAGERRDHLAIRWLGKRGETRDLTNGDLRRLTNRFANVLAGLGVGKGDRVFLLAGRIPELYVGVLGALKNRSVACTLFSAFGPEPIRQRLALGDGRVLVTTEALYRRKVAGIRQALPALEHVLLVGPGGAPTDVPGTQDLGRLLAAAGDDFEIGPTDPEDMALLHFTSGTTGTPKGAVHVHQAVVAHHATGAFALDLHPEDVFWCTADPGWVTGTSYGIISPLTHGMTSIVDEAEYDPERWFRILAEQRVSVWYNVYAKTLRDHWKGLLGWGVGLAAMAALEVAVYPSIRERAAEMNRLVANYPEAFKAMFGLEDFTSGAGFIQAELYSLVVPLVLTALAISFGAGATAGEEEHKTVDLLLATPVTRSRVVVQKLLALVTGTVLVGLALVAVLWVGSAAQDMGIGLDGLLAATASAVLLGLCFGAVALAVGCATGRRALAAAAAAGLAIAGFLVNSLSALAEGLKPWRPLTLFYQYAGNDPLRNGLDIGDAAVLLAVAALMALAALVAFQRRDLAT